MKIKNLGATLFVMTLALTAHAQLEVKSTGKVEIGTNPNTSNLFVEGNASISNTLSVQRVNAYNVTTYLFTKHLTIELNVTFQIFQIQQLSV